MLVPVFSWHPGSWNGSTGLFLELNYIVIPALPPEIYERQRKNRCINASQLPLRNSQGRLPMIFSIPFLQLEVGRDVTTLRNIAIQGDK
jgi:hypothetical protein